MFAAATIKNINILLEEGVDSHAFQEFNDAQYE